MPQTLKYKIILIEPSPVIQQGLKSFLDADPRFSISHCFFDFQTFENSLLKDDFQIIIVNPLAISYHKQFSPKSLFAKYPDTFLVALVYNYVDAEILSTFDGVLDIYSPGPQLIKKLQKVLETTNTTTQKNTTDSIDLSDREKEILISVAIGLTNKEIADRHNISVHTVVSHRKNISRKIGIKTVSGLTIYAIFNNLISESDIQ